MSHSLRVLLLVFRNFRLVARHVELRRTFAADNREPFFGRALEFPIVNLAVLIFRLHIQHILHVELEQVSSARSDHAGSLVDFKAPTSSVTHDEVVDVVVSVGVAGLQSENRGVWWCIQLHDRLHRQGAVDEVGRFVVDIWETNEAVINNDFFVIAVYSHLSRG